MSIQESILIKYPELNVFLQANKEDGLEVVLPVDKRFYFDLDLIGTRSVAINALQCCVYFGKYQQIKHLPYRTKKELQAAVMTDNFFAFYLLAYQGDLACYNYLSALLDDVVLNRMVDNNQAILLMAAKRGHLSLLERLINHMSTESLHLFIHKHLYEIVRDGNHSVNTLVVNQLLSFLPPEGQSSLILSNQYQLFKRAVQAGDIKLLKLIIGKLSVKDVKKVLKDNKNSIFQMIAASGNIEVVKLFEVVLTKKEFISLLKSNKYQFLQTLAAHGFYECLVHCNNYFSRGDIRSFIKKNHHQVLKSIAQGLACDEKKDLLKVFQYLLSYFTDSEREEIYKAEYYSLINHAMKYGNTDLILFLLKDPATFNQIDTSEHITSQKYLTICVNKQLSGLFKQISTFEHLHLDDVFDIDNNEVDFYFILLRHLIRRNKSEDIDIIKRMLNIPSLRKRAHCGYLDIKSKWYRTGFTGLTSVGDRENQLLKLAYQVGNLEAASSLLTVTKVNELAILNDFYRSSFDTASSLKTVEHSCLADIARDGESSMRAVSELQKEMAKAIHEKYNPTLVKMGGVGHVFKELKSTLVKRYASNPAKITLGEGTYSLPIAYKEFIKFCSAHKLTKEQRSDALKAYYQHEDHTALRYLSKPNHWIAYNAEYVEVDSITKERWASFEDFIPLISYLYLAASDITVESIISGSVGDRLTLFIRQLALLGRAHNWDERDKRGQEKDKFIHGDMPSCYRGVLKRLYQSVIGHPLFSCLTDESLNLELQSFIRQHMNAVISEMSLESILALERDITQSIIMQEVNGKELPSIAQFDVGIKEMQAFEAMMVGKWGSIVKRFVSAKLMEAFLFTDDHFTTHLAKFYSSAGIHGLIQARKKVLLEETASKPCITVPLIECHTTDIKQTVKTDVLVRTGADLRPKISIFRGDLPTADGIPVGDRASALSI